VSNEIQILYSVPWMQSPSRISRRLALPNATFLHSHARQPLRRCQARCLLTLAIETSCDDTAVAIVEKTASSATLHFNEKVTANNSTFRGIHPLVALESHQENLSALILRSLSSLPDRDVSPGIHNTLDASGEDGIFRTKQMPDFISVTRGPGMRSNLNTGIDTAKGLAVAWGIPMVGVHHMHAHALTPRLVSALACGSTVTGTEELQNSSIFGQKIQPDFPFLSLLVSGGHTLLLHTRNLTEHRVLADTDCAVGDCLDKIARAVLPQGLLLTDPSTSYGPLLERFAFPGDRPSYNYTAPKSRHVELMQSEAPSAYGWPFALPFVRDGSKFRSMEFSFAGISSYGARVAENGWDPVSGKLRHIKREQPIIEDEARLLAQESMRVCFEHIASRIVLALESETSSKKKPSQTLVLSGGVAANKFLKHVITAFLSARGFSHVKIITPPIDLCTDNAAMIGWAGCEMFEAGFSNSLSIRSLRKWSLENVVNPERELEVTGIAHTAAKKLAHRL
jgi:N6-L-threonylcarbamoyladenine synthase